MSDGTFHRAARDGYLDPLRRATRKDLNTADEDGMTPTMWAASYGNLAALRMIVGRGGDPDKMDLMGFTSLHHSCKSGHINVASFLINYGANIWAMDNDYKTSQDIASLWDKTEIIKLLDDAKSQQQQLNPSVVKKLCAKAFEDADRNGKRQDRRNKEAQKIAEKEDSKRLRQIDHDFKPPSKMNVFKTLTMKLRSTNRKYIGNDCTSVQTFSDIAIGTKSRGTKKKILQKQNIGIDSQSVMDFKTSEFDGEGNRTLRSMKGTNGFRKNSDVMYLTTKESDNGVTASGTRPALANVFSLPKQNKWKSESDLIDSGTGSIDSTNVNEEDSDNPGMFRNALGTLSFLHTRQGLTGTLNGFTKASSYDFLDEIENDIDIEDERSKDSNRNSTGTDSIGTTTSLEERLQGPVPWKDDDDLFSDDDEEDESEFSPLVRFLESCGLSNYTYIFTNEDTDLDALMLLTDDDFTRLGLRLGPQRKLKEAIKKRKEALESPSVLIDSHL
ncbi:pre-mRNA splicing regulator USH1G-like [Ylistrum balloti]|uniref:pre-mRNA splicing regulator USH1G-like n=1 Tax=Ylistrum balloti TaxID=509963 RepID=UPI002905A391|nr:pre-mRNA splicing regulator USH1G-like [Ylistrum balloti]